MSGTALEESPYSHHFKVLTILGGWILNTRNPVIRNVHVFYRTFMMLGSSFLCLLLYVNLYLVFGDVKKMTWNLCISTLFTGGLIKNNFTLYRCNVINRLRRNLHQKATSRVTPDDEELNRSSAKELRTIEYVYYVAGVIFVPLWLLSRYFGDVWGGRDLPVPIWIPFEVDLENEFQYHLFFFLISAGGVAGIIFVMTIELIMFTFLIQISREYDRLIKDFSKINEFFSRGERRKASGQEMNPYLRELKIKKQLREYTIRQQQLTEYTRDFELSYCYPMLLQFFVAAVLFVVCALLCLTEYDKLTLNITYQLGYLFVILMDMLLFCWFTTRIRSQCLRVGEVAYFVFWYKMGIDIQKDICMIIRRSQHPPKITSGKLVEMDLHAFMLLMRTIYSWLTLFEQLAF